MLNIGICDDKYESRNEVYDLCKEFFNEIKIEHNYIFFSSGNEVLDYCNETAAETIDLLFLDVEMPGINGIELKDAVIKHDKIWRIVFVTNHKESIYSAFSKKTIGFISKPPAFDEIKKMILITKREIEENTSFLLNGYDGSKKKIFLDDIIYFKASGSYTEIVTYKSLADSENSFLCSKKIGVLEKEIGSNSLMRVHKSYVVNLENVIDIGDKVFFHNTSLTVPVGRSYKENAKKTYLLYGKNRIIQRL